MRTTIFQIRNNRIVPPSPNNIENKTDWEQYESEKKTYDQTIQVYGEFKSVAQELAELDNAMVSPVHKKKTWWGGSKLVKGDPVKPDVASGTGTVILPSIPTTGSNASRVDKVDLFKFEEGFDANLEEQAKLANGIIAMESASKSSSKYSLLDDSARYNSNGSRTNKTITYSKEGSHEHSTDIVIKDTEIHYAWNRYGHITYDDSITRETLVIDRENQQVAFIRGTI